MAPGLAARTRIVLSERGIGITSRQDEEGVAGRGVVRMPRKNVFRLFFFKRPSTRPM